MLICKQMKCSNKLLVLQFSENGMSAIFLIQGKLNRAEGVVQLTEWSKGREGTDFKQMTFPTFSQLIEFISDDVIRICSENCHIFTA